MDFERDSLPSKVLRLNYAMQMRIVNAILWICFTE